MNQISEIIGALIRQSGPITFAKFMELALYHPEHGYYSSGKAKLGKAGDYYTSPCVHPAFGEILGRFIYRASEVVDAPDFTVVEMGAGKGFLALDILDSLKRNYSEFYDRLNFIIIEQSPHLRDEGKVVLKAHSHKIRWVDFLASLEKESMNGVFISNELVDSFPFHRCKFKDGKLLEIFVGLAGEDFVESLEEPSSTDLSTYFQNYDLQFEDGQEVEVSLRAGEWLSDVASALSRGFALTIDYGFMAPELYSFVRMKGTFRCFHQHRLNENPYINIGEQDITADVDFSNLVRVGNRVGLNTVKYTTQGQFLVDWGILDVLETYSSSDISSEKSRMAIKNLFLPGLMGDRFKVLIQEKNLKETVKNFYPESSFRISFQKPLDRFNSV
ncbi:MAG TPA: SAM-dependent methyltransferase [Thermodesulfobacteriota bacterium]|nr:SAM-dependent methyltransferase [Thermodesulfobacteriota bacterium]